MFKIIGATDLRVFCLAENATDGEVFELPILHRHFCSYWTLRQKYPPDPNEKLKFMNQHVFDGRFKVTARPNFSSRTARKSRWSK